MRAILTVGFVGRATKYVPPPVELRFVPLCLGHGLLMSQAVTPIAGDCAWCIMGDDPWPLIRSGRMPGIWKQKKIIRGRLTVR